MSDVPLVHLTDFFLSSYRVNVTSSNHCERAKVPGHIELKIGQNPSLVKLVEGF